MSHEAPVYSHNPYHATAFPLLVLDVNRGSCSPANEGFGVLHWHDEVQFVSILEGDVTFRIYDQELTLSGGDCMFINQAVLHQIPANSDCHYHSFLVPVQMLEFYPDSSMALKQVRPYTANPAITHLPLRSGDQRHQQLLELVDRLNLLYLMQEQSDYYEYRISLNLCQIWLELISLLSPAARLSAASATSQERIRAMITYIHTHYSEAISLQDIAAAAHISQTESLRCFQRFVHDTPYRYLLQYRLHRSTPLLAGSNTSITDIALQVGFQSASSYIQYFRRYYQLTPNQYRKAKQFKTTIT